MKFLLFYNNFFMQRRHFLNLIFLAIATFTLLAIVPIFSQQPIQAQSNANLLVSAAASLKESLEEIKLIYEKNNPNININYNFGASGALQQQIENGAPVDVFISAGKKQMDALQSKKLIINDSRRNILTNHLVLIVPNNLDITNFQQLTLAKVQRIAIGEPRSVPVGQYTQEVFKKLGILEKIQSKLVLANNVRQVLAAVESGNANAGVVYITDAKTSKLVKVVETAPENLHFPIIYPVAALKNSKSISAAKQYIQFLSDKQARAIFEKYGFGIAK
jgi:molybdate transport system substrate-binding protein